MSSRKSGELEAGGITVSLSNTDKLFYPDDGIRKGDVIGYYQAVADRMLPYLRDRPLVMGRYPDGIAGEGIIQKKVPAYFPDWIQRVDVPRIGGRGGAVSQVVCDKPATVAYLANQACVEFHLLLSRLDALDQPDQVVFDLDPPDDEHFDDVRRCALDLRRVLEDDLGLAAYVKTTGGKGLHVHVPLRPAEGFDPVREFARQVAELLVRQDPGGRTLEQRVQSRGDRVYLDIMRNGYAQMAVAPYSLRARPGAQAATPLHWSELDDAGLRPGLFTMRTIADRLAGTDDPWADMPRRRHDLAPAARRLESLAARKAS